MKKTVTGLPEGWQDGLPDTGVVVHLSSMQCQLFKRNEDGRVTRKIFPATLK